MNDEEKQRGENKVRDDAVVQVWILFFFYFNLSKDLCKLYIHKSVDVKFLVLNFVFPASFSKWKHETKHVTKESQGANLLRSFLNHTAVDSLLSKHKSVKQSSYFSLSLSLSLSLLHSSTQWRFTHTSNTNGWKEGAREVNFSLGETTTKYPSVRTFHNRQK